MAVGEGGIGPFQQQRRARHHAIEPDGNRGQLITALLHDHVRLRSRAGELADQTDRVDHLVERHRVERQDLRATPQVGDRIVDLGHIDRADGTQVLGHDQRRIEVGERIAVETVQVLAGRHPLLHDGVDLGGCQPFG